MNPYAPTPGRRAGFRLSARPLDNPPLNIREAVSHHPVTELESWRPFAAAAHADERHRAHAKHVGRTSFGDVAIRVEVFRGRFGYLRHAPSMTGPARMAIDKFRQHRHWRNLSMGNYFFR